MAKKNGNKKVKLTQKQEIYLGELKACITSYEEKQQYSIQRLDILLITVSSSAIILVANALDKIKDFNYWFVFKSLFILNYKTAIILFTSSIVCNLFSQGIAYSANRRLAELHTEKVRALQYEGAIDEPKFDKLINNAFSFGRAVGWLNAISLWSLALGIALSVFIFLKVEV